MSNASADGDGAIQSVDRALLALEALARAGPSGGAEIARQLDVHRSTALRLLGTLERHGLVDRDARSGSYRLGRRLTELAGAVSAEVDLRQEAHPVLEQLADRAGETVTLDVLDAGGDRVLHIDQVSRSAGVVGANWLGRRTPLHCTAPGKLFLALGPDGVRRHALAAPLPRYTARTVVDGAALEAQLARIRQAGYAYTTEELEVGLNAYAAPVHAVDGRLLAAITLSGPSHRLPGEHAEAWAALAREAASDLSRRLGHGVS
jgi:DNA-binding IclR family transcriptional regulator